ncbi:MAG: tRNA (N6-isopentenyl adenosine(37)-C2)-methylthiotransferase MiaB [Bacteroidetes bacterium]|nr:tRNA (N6-isopentenyl adenosine(37)-C2)-methylthiotransferase MiaB [Bacteroidota bacterium]
MLHEGNKVIDEKRQGEAILLETAASSGKKLFLESYGCAMNFSDSEIVASILTQGGFETTRDYNEADVIFINTCAIRDNAEQRVRTRLHDFKKAKRAKPGLIVGVLGCMAERLKSKLLEEEKLVDIVAGPDSYRDLLHLIEKVEGGQKAVNVLLSREETYADISPVRLSSNGVTAFISIMRGCDNMCSFCVVPFTRGRERSRDPESILEEAKQLFENGYREVTLLGQNVDSYLWWGGGQKKELEADIVHKALHHELPAEEQQRFTTFADLMEMVAGVHPDLQIRFSTSNPRDMTDAVLHVIAKYDNICKYVHLPVQSGNSNVLERMNRGYTREQYIQRIESIRRIIPECGISTDIISGFCGETEEEHQDTLSLMEWAGYDFSYMFKYSERPGTAAEKKFTDDIPEEVKSRRLQEIVDLQRKLSAIRTKKAVGKTFRVLVEGVSKKSDEMLSGRNSQNTVVVFPKGNLQPGDYVNVRITHCTTATLIGEIQN